jgi:hypothetical protein
MATPKFYSLYLGKLRLGDLAGLCTETVNVAKLLGSLDNPLLSAKLSTLNIDTEKLRTLMNRQRASALTPQLRAMDGHIYELFAEVKRTAKTAEKSSNPEKSAAAKLLLPVLKPFWDVTKQAMPSQSAQLTELFQRVSSNTDLKATIPMLELDVVWKGLTDTKTQFNLLYDQRVKEEAVATAPSGHEHQEYRDARLRGVLLAHCADTVERADGQADDTLQRGERVAAQVRAPPPGEARPGANQRRPDFRATPYRPAGDATAARVLQNERATHRAGVHERL